MGNRSTAVEQELDVMAKVYTSGATAPDVVTREQRRSRRKRPVRARTISVKRMTKRELELGRMLFPEQGYWKPRLRSECAEGPRPCPFVSCQHHLFVDVSPRTGAIKLNFPDIEVWQMGESCALDIADRGGTTLEDVGAIMNLTRERIRQVEVRALAKLQAVRGMDVLREFVDEGPQGRRRLPTLSAEERDELGLPTADSEGAGEDGAEEADEWTQEADLEPVPLDDLDAEVAEA
jgi:hypothetical protein